MNKYNLMHKFLKPVHGLIFFLFAFLLIQTVPVYGQTTPTLGVVEKLKKIEVLKEKIATKVAQLREEEKGALAGTVKTLNSDQMTVATRTGDRTIVFADDTVVYLVTRDGKTETNIKKIKVEQAIVVFGYFDEKKETLSAKYIYLTNPSVHLLGKIADIDKTNYTISVKEPKGTTTVDIETTTKTYFFDKNNNLIRGGFSKFKVGDIVHIQAAANPKKENAIIADRVIIASTTIVPTPSATLTPAKKITPKPTVEE